MHENTIPLTQLSENKKAQIITINGGHHFQQKLRVMGIREGQTITLISRQPFRGPLTITIGGSQMTLGRGMAHRIIVKELQ
jgi:ferrous iron transport protein A